MSGKFVRASKYRHVFGEASRDVFSGYTKATVKTDSLGLAVNGTYIAAPLVGGGGPVAVVDRSNPGRADINMPTVNVHSSSVLDVAFSPFAENILATASDDCKVAVTVLSAPDEKFSKSIQLSDNATTVFAGHQKKATAVRFHPTTNVLASTSMDNTVKIWDLLEGEEIYSFDDHPENVNDLQFNRDGSLLATVCKDKRLRLYDPRQSASVQDTQSFDSSKTSKLFWANNLGTIGAVGFSRTSVRQIVMWDPRSLDKPLVRTDLDQAAGIMYPWFDQDSSMVYFSGKGDGSIKYYEVDNQGDYFHFLSQYRDTNSTRAIGWAPKRYCNVNKCEVAVAVRLVNANLVPVSFQVPRKADNFHADLYPDTYAGIAGMEVDEYRDGKNVEPASQSMKPGAAAAAAAPVKERKTRGQLEQELKDANATIEALRAEIASLKA